MQDATSTANLVTVLVAIASIGFGTYLPRLMDRFAKLKPKSEVWKFILEWYIVHFSAGVTIWLLLIVFTQPS